MSNLPTMSSMRSSLTNLGKKEENPTNNEKTYRPADPQEVSMNNVPDNEEVKIRFVYDGDSTNSYFWRAYCFYKLSFKGIKGDDSRAGTVTTVYIPAYNVSVDKYGNKMITEGDKRCEYNVPKASEYTNYQDPIHVYVVKNKLYEQKDRMIVDTYGNEISLYDALKRNTQQLFQGYIVSGQEHLKIYEDARPLKHFRFGSQILGIVRNYVNDEDNDAFNPLDLKNGVDFKFRKITNGNFPKYDTSTFGRKCESVAPEFAADFERYGADFIGDRIPKTPTEAERAVIQNMLDAFLGNLPYDPEWDTLHYPKFVRNPKNNETSSEPTWNTPSSVYTGSVEPETSAQVQAAVQQAQAVLNDITGSANTQTVEQQVNDSVPFGGSPAQPVAQPAPVSSNLSQEETLSFLNTLNNI